MKLKTIILCFFVLVFSVACKKEAGPGGKNVISGTVVYKNGATGNNDTAPMATVSISYGTSESTTTSDQTIVTDADGKYSIEGLNKGEYFIKAGYADVHGFNYNTKGYCVTFKNKKKNLEVNIVLE